MGKSILTLVQDFCDKKGLPTPSALIGSQEKSIKQYRALVTELLDDLAEHRWPAQHRTVSWFAAGDIRQGEFPDFTDADFAGIVANTMWNETRRMRVYGPVTDQVWQALRILPNAGPEYQCWVGTAATDPPGRAAGPGLYISPAPASGDAMSVVIISGYLVRDSLGATPKQTFTDDSDTTVIPDNVFRHGLEYKWRKQKGESGWEDDYNTFIGLVAKNIIRDSDARLSLSRNNHSMRPGIIIPAGNWNV